MPGVATERWNHAWWNTFYQHILCFSYHSQQVLEIGGNAHVVGDPRFDAWHRGEVNIDILAGLRLDPKKPTLLYVPAAGAVSSLMQWAAPLSRLRREYNLIVTLPPAVPLHEDDPAMQALLKRHLNRHLAPYDLALLQCADVVLTDRCEVIFDAVHAGKKVVITDVADLDTDATLTPLRGLVPALQDISELRHLLNDGHDWQEHDAALEAVREHYCDAFRDGNAGKRAARVVMDAVASPPETSTLLASLQQKLFR